MRLRHADSALLISRHDGRKVFPISKAIEAVGKRHRDDIDLRSGRRGFACALQLCPQTTRAPSKAPLSYIGAAHCAFAEDESTCTAAGAGSNMLQHRRTT